MRAVAGSGPGSSPSSSGLGSGGGGSKGASSRASLHSKAAIVDGRLAVIGSMNLDLRSKVKNSEVALVIRSASFAKLCADRIGQTMRKDARKLLEAPVEDGKELSFVFAVNAANVFFRQDPSTAGVWYAVSTSKRTLDDAKAWKTVCRIMEKR